MKQSVRILLHSLIDYAGMFPPASLSLEKAVANYLAYARGEYSFALGRFVVQAERMREVPADVPVSVLGKAEALPDSEVVEVKAGNEQEIERIAAQAKGRTVYVEVGRAELLEAVAAHKLRAKIRTGGVTADAFPSAASIATFVEECRRRDLPFKATAGLHHPIRCHRPLTYEPESPSGAMHGFVNLLMAAALPEHALSILNDENPRSFAVDEGGLWWRDCRVTQEEIQRVRARQVISFGSCSFGEPISDLKELGWL